MRKEREENEEEVGGRKEERSVRRGWKKEEAKLRNNPYKLDGPQKGKNVISGEKY